MAIYTFVFRFLFSIGPDGLVTMVYHHHEDEHEVLSLKKVLASTLSAKVTVSNQRPTHGTVIKVRYLPLIFRQTVLSKHCRP